MKKVLLGAGMLGVLFCSLLPVRAQESFKTLDAISADQDTVRVTLSGETKYRAFKVSNPPRLVLEFSNTEFNARNKEIAVNSPLIKRIRGGQYENEPVKLARIVVDLKKMAPYELNGSGSKVTLVFKQPAAPAAKAVSAAPAATTEAVKAEAVKAAAVPAPPVTAEKLPAAETKPKAKAPATERKFPVAAALVSEEPGSDVLIAAPVESSASTQIFPEPAAPASKPPKIPENKPEPAVQPAPPPEKAAAPIPVPAAKTEQKPAAATAPADEKPAAATNEQPQNAAPASRSVVLPKKPVTLDFEEADIRDVLRIMSMKSGINIIYGADVSGTVTLRLDEVPFDKAFETILALKNLVSQEQGPNILRVVSPQKIADERSQAVAFTRIFPLNYAKAEEIKVNLDSIRSAEGRRGNISVDQRTNSLIVTDTPEGLLAVERFIRELDLRPSQVIIEAKIVEVVLNNSFDLGIQWQYADTWVNGSNNKFTVGATKAQTSDTVPGGGTPALANTVLSPTAATGVTFPAAAVNGQISAISFGIINNNMRLSGILNALAQKGKSKLLSSPKVTTINNKEAKILVGQRIPYTTSIVSNGIVTQQTNFLDVGVKLTVTPTINIDQKITLQVHPEVSLYVRSDSAGPVIGTREALTTVLVNNSETVVIGGLITDEDRKQGTMVPLLGEIPIIGHLFRRDFNTKDRTELLVFITPHIINN